MKNIFVGLMVAVALFTAPMVHAQVATSSAPVVQSQLDSLRQELIGLLIELISRLQAQLDAQVVEDQEQDEQISVIKKRVNIVDEPVEDVDTTEEDISDARKRVGEVKATANVQEDDGEYTVAFSMTNYLNVDSIRYSASVDSLETEGGCSAIQDSDYEVCGLSVVFPITSTSSDLRINASVNGDEKSLVVEFGKRGVEVVTWPNP